MNHEFGWMASAYGLWAGITTVRAVYAPIGTFNWYVGIVVCLVLSSAGGWWLRGVRDDQSHTSEDERP